MVQEREGSERGSVAITVALALTLLLGFAALVVDVGLNWAARTSAQTAADSAALAGAAQLLADGPGAAVVAVEGYLNGNVAGLADVPADPDWAVNGDESDGEIVCWTLPAGPPDAGADCPPGSNALQVITPPIEVNYAFAGVFGESSNTIKAMAAAGAGPAAPNNCVLCLLDPDGASRLATLGPGGVAVTGGGIAVNSDNPAALVAGLGDISADQIQVVGGVAPSGGGQLLPLPEVGGPPVADPLADLPTPDQLASPPTLQTTAALSFSTNTTLEPGIYSSVTVTGGATLTLEAGIYVFRGFDGLTVRDNARVVGSGDGVTIYLACSGYPAPCSGPGARFRLEGNGRYLANPPTGGDYAGLSIFADPGNTRTMFLRSNRTLNLAGALYGARTPLRLQNSGGLNVDSLLVVDSLQATGTGAVGVDYDPSVPLPGVGRPVLIR